MSPATYPLVSIPSSALAQCHSCIAPIITRIINLTFEEGTIPKPLKIGIITPLQKKPGGDINDMSNYRPITSNRTVAKLMEGGVAQQLQSHVETHKLLEVHQSGFRPLHSTESTLVNLWDEILATADEGESSFLILIDMSAAFDTVRHDILVQRLSTDIGVQPHSILWFKNFLTDRTQRVKLGDYYSEEQEVKWGVPQGSPLSPLLFNIYLRPLLALLREQGITFESYADDTQIFLAASKSSTNYSTLYSGLNKVKTWLRNNHLKLNPKKTELILFNKSTTSGVSGLIIPRVFEQDLPVLSQVKSLGIVLDKNMTLRPQIDEVIRRTNYIMFSLRKILPILPQRCRALAVGALVNSHLDYANAIYNGLPEKDLKKLQLIQNRAVRLALGLKFQASTTEGRRTLHWLPVKARIRFKVLCLTFKAIHQIGPRYFQMKIKKYFPTRQLRSSTACLLSVPKTKLKTRGDRRIAVQGPLLWNRLPLTIRACDNFLAFRRMIKTLLFE